MSSAPRPRSHARCSAPSRWSSPAPPSSPEAGRDRGRGGVQQLRQGTSRLVQADAGRVPAGRRLLQRRRRPGSPSTHRPTRGSRTPTASWGRTTTVSCHPTPPTDLARLAATRALSARTGPGRGPCGHGPGPVRLSTATGPAPTKRTAGPSSSTRASPRPTTGTRATWSPSGAVDEAMAAASRALALDSVSPVMHSNMARQHCTIGSSTTLPMEGFQRTIAIDPAYIYGHLGLGLVLIQLGRPDDAAARFAHALEIMGQPHPMTLALRGHALGLAGSAAEARQILRPAGQDPGTRVSSCRHEYPGHHAGWASESSMRRSQGSRQRSGMGSSFRDRASR
jgi:hypothetical protein